MNQEDYENLTYTDHAHYRLDNRSISKEEVLLCVKYGEIYYKTGIKFYVLTKKVIIRKNLDDCLEGLCVLVSHDNIVITAYKNRDALSEIKKLSKSNMKKSFRDYGITY